MSGILDDKFTPPANALTIWRDDRNIYVLLPAADGKKAILSYPFAVGGLAKVIELLGPPPDHAGTPIPYTTYRKTKRTGTVTQHNLAESILRKRGLIK